MNYLNDEASRVKLYRDNPELQIDPCFLKHDGRTSRDFRLEIEHESPKILKSSVS